MESVAPAVLISLGYNRGQAGVQVISNRNLHVIGTQQLQYFEQLSVYV